MTYVGTPGCISPEITSKINQTVEVDTWSLGITLLELLVHDVANTGNNGSTSRMMRSFVERYSHEGDLVEFVSLCLQHNATNRLTPTEALQHSFIAKLDTKSVIASKKEMLVRVLIIMPAVIMVNGTMTWLIMVIILISRITSKK